jgi:hypothetical protein
MDKDFESRSERTTTNERPKPQTTAARAPSACATPKRSKRGAQHRTMTAAAFLAELEHARSGGGAR